MAELSEEERKRYERARDQYKEVKTAIEAQIKDFKESIEVRKSYLARLRPVLPGADRECDKCDLVSMKYVGSFPYNITDLEGDFVQRSSRSIYECMICGNTHAEPVNSFD